MPNFRSPFHHDVVVGGQVLVDGETNQETTRLERSRETINTFQQVKDAVSGLGCFFYCELKLKGLIKNKIRKNVE